MRPITELINQDENLDVEDIRSEGSVNVEQEPDDNRMMLFLKKKRNTLRILRYEITQKVYNMNL